MKLTRVTLYSSRRFRGVETVLENGPPIGWHTFSSDLICQRMSPVATFLPVPGPSKEFKQHPSSSQWSNNDNMYVQFYIVSLIGYTMTGEVANKSMSTIKGQSAEYPGTLVAAFICLWKVWHWLLTLRRTVTGIQTKHCESSIL